MWHDTTQEDMTRRDNSLSVRNLFPKCKREFRFVRFSWRHQNGDLVLVGDGYLKRAEKQMEMFGTCWNLLFELAGFCSLIFCEIQCIHTQWQWSHENQNVFLICPEWFTLQGGCIHGSPSICIGILFVVLEMRRSGGITKGKEGTEENRGEERKEVEVGRRSKRGNKEGERRKK